MSRANWMLSGRTPATMLAIFAALYIAGGGRAVVVYGFAAATMFIGTRPTRSYWDVKVSKTLGMAAAWVAVALLALVLGVLVLFDRTLEGAWTALLVAAACAVTAVALERFARSSTARQRFMVMASADEIRRLQRELRRTNTMQLKCVGAVASDADGDVVFGLADAIQAAEPALLVLGDGPEKTGAIEQLLHAPAAAVKVVSIQQFYGYALGRVPVEHLSPVWFMGVMHVYGRRVYSQAAKRIVDVLLASTAIVVGSPVFLLLVLLVRASGPGPILFRQTRLGEGGRPFEILKLRTMVAGAEGNGEARWAAEDDPRITGIGRVLRQKRLDELPQIWNVLRGDMSLVGPRPERPEFLETLEQEVPFWTSRHLVKPGITGWAQINMGYADDVSSAATKLSYDLFYLRHQSIWMDAVIAFATIRVMALGPVTQPTGWADVGQSPLVDDDGEAVAHIAVPRVVGLPGAVHPATDGLARSDVLAPVRQGGD